jgi:NitT/TauT family transport system permease protein
VIWFLLTLNKQNIFFPKPLDVLKRLFELFQKEWLVTNLMPSVSTVVLGFIIGSFFGICIGILLNLNVTILSIFYPILNFIRGIPSVAKIPVIIAIFGLGHSTRIITVSIAVFAPVILATTSAISNTPPEYENLGHVLGLRKFQLMTKIKIPAALGEILTSLEVGLQIAILVMIISEFLGAGFGVGSFIIHSQNIFKIYRHVGWCFYRGIINFNS